MQVLGWIDKSDAARWDVLRVDTLALVVTDMSKLDRRGFALAQCEIAENVASFLPASVGIALDVGRAVEWTKMHADQIAARLRALQGRAQVTLSLRAVQGAETSVAEKAQGSWLRQRASQQRTQGERLTQAARRLREFYRCLNPVETALAQRQGALNAHILVPRAGLEHALAQTTSALERDGPRQLPGWSCALAGPLPAFSFASLDA